MFVRTEGVTWSWEWNWLGTAVILFVLMLYLRGRSRHKQSAIKTILFICGLSLLFLISASPLNHLATQLFSIRILQRILLIAVIPLLLIGSNSIPILYAGLPLSAQLGLQRFPTARQNAYQFIHRITTPAAIWLTFICIFWLGYDLNFHHLTLQSRTVHGLEILALFIIACFYWWHILAASPQIHKPMPPLVRIGYVLAGAIPIKIIGLVLLFTSSKIYNYPGSVQIGYLSITDQSLGAMFHWSLGGIVFTWTGMYLMRAWFGIEAQKPILPHTSWSTTEMMLAPGFGDQSTEVRSQPLSKKTKTNKVHIKSDEETQECPNTRKSSNLIAVPVKIFLIIKSRVVTLREN